VALALVALLAVPMLLPAATAAALLDPDAEADVSSADALKLPVAAAAAKFSGTSTVISRLKLLLQPTQLQPSAMADGALAIAKSAAKATIVFLIMAFAPYCASPHHEAPFSFAVPIPCAK
jgi:hypothetical protein